MAKTKLSIEEEILKKAGLKSRSKKETDQEYRSRVARGVDDWCKAAGDSDAADARFETLSEGAQDWCSSAAEAVNDKTEIPEFPMPAGASPEGTTQPHEGDEKEKPMKTKKEKGLKKAPKGDKPAKVKKEKAPRGPGKHSIFRKRVIEAYLRGEPGAKVKFAAVYEPYAEKAGADAITQPSASVVFSNTVQTLQIAEELGALKR